RAGLAAGRAPGAHPAMGFDSDFDVLLSPFTGEADIPENKASEALNPVQNCLNVELDGWPPWLISTTDWKPNRTTGSQPSFLLFAGGLRREDRTRHLGIRSSVPTGPNTPPTTYTHPPTVQ